MEKSSLYSHCNLCPNNCGVDRNNGQVGRCGQTSDIRIAWAGLHKGEEPPISGRHGSGMIFFCGCPLHCQYCQNHQISDIGGFNGISISEEELVTLMLELQYFGAKTINLVTGTHYIPSIIWAINEAKKEGLRIPIVWNSSGYESVSALRMIDPLIDIYLIDVKTLDAGVATRFCGLQSYVPNIIDVMKFLKRRYPETDLDDAQSGVLVRHLVFPGCVQESAQVLGWLHDNFESNFEISLMFQFVSPKKDDSLENISRDDARYLKDLYDKYDFDGYVQQISDDESEWIPNFTKDLPFPKNFAKTLPYFLKLKAERLKG